MKRKTYPKYKPSGVEWLGDVPEHWEVKRLKMAAHLTDKKVEADEEHPVPFIGMENIESWTGRLLPISPNVVPTGTANAFKVGHTLFGKLRPYLAKACNPNFDGLCSTELLVLKSHDLDQHALLYLLLSDGFVKLVDSSTYGSKMPRASWDFIGNCVLPVPSAAEQRAIAAFLDRETGRIDTLIAKKRELVERLKEKRTALISHTVTHGLPPDAAKKAGLPVNPPLRPSGVEWLGDIPEHWNTMSLKWHSRCHSGDGISTDDVSPDRTIERCIPVIGGNGVMGYCDRLNCNHQVLVIGRVGALCGNVHHIVSPAWITDNALVMQTDPATFVREYLAAVLRTRNLNELADKTAQPLITGTRIRSERVPVPPLPEQAAIAAYLDAETSKLDALISKLEETVERMQEYRTALITAAVTGKIDVRGNAIALRHV